MRFILETRCDDGSIGHRAEVEAIDLPSALMWAVGSWWPAQGSHRADGKGFNLASNLLIAAVPLLEAVAAFEQKAAA